MSGDHGPVLLLVIAVRLFRDGLAQLLSRAGMKVHCAEDEKVALDSARRGQPEIVLLDTHFPEAFAALSHLREASPATRIIALGIEETDEELITWAAAGVSGYVVSDASFDTLLATIRSVASGELLCSPRIAALLLRHVSRLGGDIDLDETHLTARELDVISLIDEGAGNKEIAARLHVELSTVKNHVHHILEKVGATSRLQAAARLRPLIRRHNQKSLAS